jgi:BirA family biotin operon repressor/biotin-[acetyl-CoA-carboxylase] ligase
VDSTNAELLRCSAPQRGVSVLLAERQTGGRGRRGRTWASPLAAHIYLSVLRLFPVAWPPGRAEPGGRHRRGRSAARPGLHQAQLKWPNDLMVDGKRKLVGLLAEGGGEYAGPARAVIGIGINTHMPPSFAEQITQPWVDLDTLAGKPVDRNGGRRRAGAPAAGAGRIRSRRPGSVPAALCRVRHAGRAPKYAWNWKGSGSTAPRWPGR